MVGDERAAAAAAQRVQVAALHQRGQRLAQRRARDPELAAQLPLGRQALAGLQQAELDRGPEPLERLLERGLRVDRGENRVRGADHNRSKPRRRSQSVTAES